jgi:PAP2 superfamily
MHIGYALVVAASLLFYGRPALLRALGVLYPPAVLLVVVATGNHFFIDAAAGALAAGLGATAATVLTRQATSTPLTALPTRHEPLPAIERRAA